MSNKSGSYVTLSFPPFADEFSAESRAAWRFLLQCIGPLMFRQMQTF